MKLAGTVLCVVTWAQLGSAVLPEVLDQQTTGDMLALGGGGALTVANNISCAQTFTAELEGTLSSVTVAVLKGSATSADLTMSIWAVSPLGVPVTPVAFSTVAASTIPAELFEPTLVTFTGFSQAVAVHPGEKWAIRLDSPAPNNPPFDMRYNWFYDLPGDYAEGRSFVYGGLNFDAAAADFRLQTFVTPVPEPATLSLLGLGSLALVTVRRRR